MVASLSRFGRYVGLAFQIADDLLDVESSAAVTGKPVGQDQVAGKATFVAVLGVEEARRRAKAIANRAASHLVGFEERAELLCEMALFVVNRRS